MGIYKDSFIVKKEMNSSIHLLDPKNMERVESATAFDLSIYLKVANEVSTFQVSRFVNYCRNRHI